MVLSSWDVTDEEEDAAVWVEGEAMGGLGCGEDIAGDCS